ncbi:MAG: BppU family phage baseplate upper protein [Clostridium sp.]|uniref:BppU family phage baseplate upper protein n=1 Tax=Clostridium TaxID=1485 RepID=UPI00232EB433|nr:MULTISPECIES: BppU family phage baseplate upper protein [Clostridium]MDB2122301.1 BppU family phage baseplate upper protein [Clostridium paraputrificum]MDU2756696.1 BppU family phage baseplate upper protein [Clostridium sp.]MDU2902228.1 BppU family phage baseplate upper protein [Clostridium sp.]MDU7462430.1 BppU family phage baseplate upper protein [Clostridium sp.]
MKFPKKVDIDVNEDFYDRIKVKQNDTARYLLFNLLDNRVPFSLENKTVRVYGVKPDGTKVFNNLTIVNAQGGLVELQLTSQMLAKSGWLKLELVIYEATDILSTIKFDIDVIASLRDDAAIESTNEFSALTLALKSVQEWEKYFEEESGKIEEKYTERLNNIEISLGEKSNIIVCEEIPSVKKENTFYFKVTEKQSAIGGNQNIKVSPNMGIKIV